MKFSVIGCGRWGSFIAWYLNEIGHDVTLYGRESSPRMQEFLGTRSNGLLTLGKNVRLTSDIMRAMDCDYIVISIGAQGLGSLLAQIKPYADKGQSFILCMKGLIADTGERLSELVTGVLGHSRVAVWLGPGHVQEFLAGIPNCMVIDSDDSSLKEDLVAVLKGPLIRFYYGENLLGNELGAASKNVIGIAAGILDGLSLSTLKGALAARGTREIYRLIEAMGGNPLCAYGLCHLGDYAATVFSPYSHNRLFGESFAKNEPFSKLAEGAPTACALYKLGKKYDVDLPICNTVYETLYENAEPRQAIEYLFNRTLKQEF